MDNWEQVGLVTHYFNQIGVAVLDVEQDLQVGDVVYFRGAHTDFEQELTSMQINHEQVDEAWPGDEVAVRVHQRVRDGDVVYRLIQEG